MSTPCRRIADGFDQDGSYCTYSAFGETGDNNTLDATYPNKGYKEKLQCGVFEPTNVISFSYELAEFNDWLPEASPNEDDAPQIFYHQVAGVQVVTKKKHKHYDSSVSDLTKTYWLLLIEHHRTLH